MEESMPPSLAKQPPAGAEPELFDDAPTKLRPSRTSALEKRIDDTRGGRMRSGYAAICALMLAIGCGDGVPKSSLADAGGAGGGSSTGRLGDGDAKGGSSSGGLRDGGVNGSRGESAPDGGAPDESTRDGGACGESTRDDREGDGSSGVLQPTPELSVAIMWRKTLYPNGGEYRYVAQRLDVVTDFQSSFTLKLPEPPPPEAEIVAQGSSCDKSGYFVEPCEGVLAPKGMGIGKWMGFIVAIDARIPNGEISREDVLGIDTEHRIFYFNHSRPYEFESSTPTPQELSWSVEFGGEEYLYPTEAGYHLAIRDPKQQAGVDDWRECAWAGLCVHGQSDLPIDQDYANWEFERCRERFPENATCSALTPYRLGQLSDPDDEPACSRACRERFKSLQNDRDCKGGAVVVPINVKAPLGLADPIAIQLGRGVWDAELR